MQFVCDNLLLEGVPFAFADAHQTKFVSLYYQPPHMTEAEVTTIALSAIRGLRLPVHEFYKDILFKPGPWTQDLSDAPTRLSVERQVATIAQELSKETRVEWKGSEGDVAARLYLGKLVTEAEREFKTLMRDDIGREALDGAFIVVFARRALRSPARKAGDTTLTIGTSVRTSTRLKNTSMFKQNL